MSVKKREDGEIVTMRMNKEKIGIIGFGRFGRILAHLLHESFYIEVYDIVRNPENNQVTFVNLEQLLYCKTIFVAVPIRHFKNVIMQIATTLPADCTIIDVCSVKMHPVDIMQSHLPDEVGIIATHPLFGPDSLTSGLPLKMMMHSTRDAQQVYHKWKSVFANKKIEIIEMTPEEHDRQASMSQGVTHLVGRILQQGHFESTQIDTVGFSKLLSIMDQTCQDTWELFLDLQRYNPYSLEMIKVFENAAKDIINQIK